MRAILLGLSALSLAACTHGPTPAPAADRPMLVINEVAAAGAPDDWFEVKNVGDAPIDLADLVFVDAADELERARAFPAFVLAPGERHVQSVTTAVAGFKLGKGEELYLYRADDGAVVDHVDWDAGASPAGGSYARHPDGYGRFVTVAADTRGDHN
jgi:hypothetical protein